MVGVIFLNSVMLPVDDCGIDWAGITELGPNAPARELYELSGMMVG